MIERWLQITCDRCGETDNATAPNMTVAEFRKDLGRAFVVRDKRDLCESCDESVKKGSKAPWVLP